MNSEHDWISEYKTNLKIKLNKIFGNGPTNNPPLYLSLKEILITDLKIKIPEIKKYFQENKELTSTNLINEDDETVVVFNLNKNLKEPTIFQYPYHGIFGEGLRFVINDFDTKISAHENVMSSSQSFKKLIKKYIKIVILKNFSFHKAYIGVFDIEDEINQKFFEKLEKNNFGEINYIVESSLGTNIEREIDNLDEKDNLFNNNIALKKNWYDNASIVFQHCFVSFNLLKKSLENYTIDYDYQNHDDL